jgi:hypothetical protein
MSLTLSGSGLKKHKSLHKGLLDPLVEAFKWWFKVCYDHQQAPMVKLYGDVKLNYYAWRFHLSIFKKRRE